MQAFIAIESVLDSLSSLIVPGRAIVRKARTLRTP
jgi:hypothetical protein